LYFFKCSRQKQRTRWTLSATADCGGCVDNKLQHKQGLKRDWRREGGREGGRQGGREGGREREREREREKFIHNQIDG